MSARQTAKALIRRSGLRRSRIAALRMCCERSLIARLPRHRATGGSRILCYHSTGTDSWGVNDVSPARFRRQIEFALEAGYRFVPAREVAEGRAGPKDLAVTFDDGLTSVAANAAPLLADFAIPWTLFVVSDWAEGRHPWGDDIVLGWRAIERLAAHGVEIGSHSVSHPNFALLDPEAALIELAESRHTIEARLGLRPDAFAIPFGQSANWNATLQRLAVEAGYRSVYAQSAERRTPGAVARTFITRFDNERVFRAALTGAFDSWEEWL